MSPEPILLVGGAGVVGSWTARFLRDAYPDVRLLICGRDLAKEEKAPLEIGCAEGIALDLAGGAWPPRALGQCVAVHFIDERIQGRLFAQARGVPYIGLSPGIIEMGREVAAYIREPECIVDATTVPTRSPARSAGSTTSPSAPCSMKTIFSGPAAEADLQLQSKNMPKALARRDGAFCWSRR